MQKALKPNKAAAANISSAKKAAKSWAMSSPPVLPIGYGGAISVMTGIQTDGQISGVVILSHNETPGLGADAEKEDYRNQYLQKAAEGGFYTDQNRNPWRGSKCGHDRRYHYLQCSDRSGEQSDSGI